MAFCPNCGTQTSGAFCPNCGAQLSGAAGGASSSAGYTTPPPSGIQSSGLSENVAGALCYTPFLVGLVCAIVFLVAAPYNRNRTVRFHTFQSLFLHLALLIFWMVLGGFISTLGFVTHGFGFLLGVFYPIIWVCILILFIVMVYKTYSREKLKLPFIGDLAEKQS